MAACCRAAWDKSWAPLAYTVVLHSLSAYHSPGWASRADTTGLVRFSIALKTLRFTWLAHSEVVTQVGTCQVAAWRQAFDRVLAADQFEGEADRMATGAEQPVVLKGVAVQVAERDNVEAGESLPGAIVVQEAAQSGLVT